MAAPGLKGPSWPIRAPGAETMAAAGKHAVGYSVGLVLVPEAESPSFRVDADGMHEVVGWGHAGPTAGLVASLRNPPANPLTVHLVVVAEIDGTDGHATLIAGLRALVDEHDRRYGGCQVWASAEIGRDLQEWVARGCPPAPGLD